MAETRHVGEWTIEDKCESPWHYLPVEVPSGVSALKVELAYEPGGGGGAALDLGCFGPDGFRGWSGGARRSFVISAKAATPGYLAGELEPGTWLVVLGLHRIPATGVRYEVTAEVSSAALPTGAGLTGAGLTGAESLVEAPPPLTDRPPRRELPAPGCGGWPGTCTRTRCIRMACSRCLSWRSSPPGGGLTFSR